MDELTAYLDNAATTRPCPAAVHMAVEMMESCYGNPSSLHAMGTDSARALSNARASVAALMGCDTESICFTSGGSEANNLAIFGAARAGNRRGRHIVTTAAEHSSVSGACKRLEDDGWEVTRIAPDKGGNIDARAVADAVRPDTVLVSMMFVNNETGAVFPAEQAALRIRKANPKALIHCDAVQAFGKLTFRAARTELDLISVSGHKVCAPKGSGALYIRRGARILPLICGGGQERGIRAGTEGLPMIAAFGAACRELDGGIKGHYERVRELNRYLRSRLAAMRGIVINSPEDASPYILNLSVPGYRSETLLHFLESRSVYVSSGSACSRGASSPVLSAMGLAPALVDSALRISLIYQTQQEELDLLVDALGEAMVKVAH